MVAKKILVTGGAGFIGSHITESLVKKGWEVTVYDNLSSGNCEYLSEVLKDVQFIEGDILDVEKLTKALKGHPWLSHQAAQLEIFRCLEDPSYDLKTNTLGTLNVLKAAQVCQVQRVIAASSACVYGQASQIPQPETHPLEPNWPYGVSKLAAEHYGRLYTEMGDMEVMDLRYGIVYGPREWLGRVLTCFLKRILEGKAPVIFGDGQQRRDFVYVEDVVRFHNLLLEETEIKQSCFNVGTAIGTTVRSLADLVIQVSGASFKPIFESTREGDVSQHMPERKRIPFELKDMILDIQRASSLGWKPMVSLEQGIANQLTWMRDHHKFWEKVGTIAV
jgi:UDP-glucose 4-epimerase